MAGEKEKKKRATSKSNFTRKLDNLIYALDDENAVSVIVDPLYDRMKEAWEALEIAHEAFLEATDIDIEANPAGIAYLDAPADQYRDVMKKYAAFLKVRADTEKTHLEMQAQQDRDAKEDARKQREQEQRDQEKLVREQEMKEKFETGKAELELAIDGFNRMTSSLKKSLESAEASDHDKRHEWKKIESEFSSIKNKLIHVTGIDHRQDVTELSDKFIADAETVYTDLQTWIFAEMKDVAPSTGGAASSSGDTSSVSTKKEAVQLPNFEGDEKKSPFLNFPTWIEQWETLIAEYDKKFWSTLLLKHLDDSAKNKFVGFETNYTEAMKRLKNFYGDPSKVISCVMGQVKSQHVIVDDDYGSLVSFTDKIECNYTRLKNIDSEHEMSNSSVMITIVRKFPRLIQENWNRHLCAQSSSVKLKPFDEFVVWLLSQREMWEKMCSLDVGRKSGRSFYGSDSGNVEQRTCYNCNQPGHMKRDCPKNNNNNNKSNIKKRTRKPPTVKKFWCAFHKDDPSRSCWSNACSDLRKMTDVSKRIQLLKDNNDCVHCCGDHRAADCKWKERVCGGGKQDRGCSNSHHMHELFCASARCYSVVFSTSENRGKVLLCIMTVRGPKNGDRATVMYDNGSEINFVREEYARKHRFKGKSLELSVTTLSGKVTEYQQVTLYTCSIRDTDGISYTFEAYGMDSITGPLTQISAALIQKLFSHMSPEKVLTLLRGEHVDFLIGMEHPSWHPSKIERAEGEGDLWVWSGWFGSCVGGSHPEIEENTRKSDALFTVNHVRPRSIQHPSSHELEYCENRVASYQSNISSRTIVEDVSVKNVVYAGDVDEDALQIVEIPPESAPVTKVVDSVCDGDYPADNVSLTARNPVKESGVVQHDDSCERDRSGTVEVTYGSCERDCSGTVEVTTLLDSQSFDGTQVQDSGGLSEKVESHEVPHSSAVDQTQVSGTPDCAKVFHQSTKTTVISDENRFFELEALGTVVDPKCGDCKCSTCPIPGSKYTHKEQQEFETIQNNLFYNEDEKCWYTKYPWTCDRHVLPKNEKIALQCMQSLERSLSKNPELAEDFCRQIDEMVIRKSARILSDDELNNWKGDYYYLPVLGVKGKKWLRLVFDASRRQGGFPSMNDCLAKGPDRFMNSLLSVIVGFRNGRVGCAGDISKFHNRVRLVPEDVHMQRFLWRGMKTNEQPKTYVVEVNNFGVTAANCIATTALNKSADMYSAVYPVESKELKEQIYIDDQLFAALNREAAEEKTGRIDEICEHASMPNKGWTYTGDKSTSAVSIGGGEEVANYIGKVLGLLWDPETDTFTFLAELTLLSKNEEGSLSESIVTTVMDFDRLCDIQVTRRTVLRNVSKIFDPCGWWCPVVLQSKLLLRESWSDELGKELSWDDTLPSDLSARWLSHLKSLLNLRKFQFPRSLWPEDEVKGFPVLVIFSDGSEKGFGAAAYIRWELQTGGYWTNLIMAKSKIAPKNTISIPKLELDGMVLGNRMKNFLLKETNLEFDHVRQLVDSSTALGYVHKECGVFNRYVGHRVAEIHSSNVFVEGKLLNWAWVAGENNPADWCTKPRSVEDIIGSDFWLKGPDFLQLDESVWPVKHSYRTDKFEDEKTVKTCKLVRKVSPLHEFIKRLIDRGSLWKRISRVLAWALRLHLPSGFAGPLDYEEVKNAKKELIKFAQLELLSELKEAADAGTGRFRKLAPVLGDDGIWRVGSRMRNIIVPFTIDAQLPKILPLNHKITKLVMNDCHNFHHAGQDGTLSRFRSQGFWAVKAGCLAKSIKNACIPCRKMENIRIHQPLGGFSYDRLNEPSAWGYCQLDLFGPIKCRGDVNPKTRKKIWGIIVEDSNSGAVHLDIVKDYSAESVIMALVRFGSLRGWPGTLCSDPGSQLESASGKLDTWWASMGDKLRTLGSEKNFKWEISPPDSPWRQGKAERRIAIVKKLLRHAVGDSVLSPLELQTALMETSNICNERPIGLSEPRADGSYQLITPNQLLMGRSSSVLPDDTPLVSEMPVKSRYRLIHHVTTSFWKMWSANVSPGLVTRQKWHKKSRNLRPGDVVLICEDSKIKAKYKLGVVDEVKVSADDVVRSATVRYVNIRKNAKGEDRVTHMHVNRSVQRLSLILPVEESTSPVIVKDHENSVECSVRL